MGNEHSTGDSDSVTRVEFTCDDTSYPFVSASERECTVELAEMVPRGDGQYTEFFNVTGAAPEQILSLAAGHGSVDATLLSDYENGGLFEFVVSENCPAVALAKAGALPRKIVATDGVGRIAAEVPAQYDPTRVIDTFLDEVSEGEFVCKEKRESFTPLFTESATCQILRSHLTDRQREVLRAALEAGYYEWPRRCTGQEVAAELDISSATFSEHIHAAERKLLTALFDES